MPAGAEAQGVVFLLDVDNTLLDNDQVAGDLRDHLERRMGKAESDRYWAIFEELRAELGYADYLGALQRFRLEHLRDPRVSTLSAFLIDYPFVERLFPRALAALDHLRAAGPTVILSDGDVVFQPHKVRRSGLWDAVGGRVLIFVHKEQTLDVVEDLYPAARYVMVDDKLRILTDAKRVWGRRLTTVYVRQGHYAADLDPSAYPAADVTVERIGDLLGLDPATLSPAGQPS
jgi:FMN phosphatase YigB (HAD superfamily)